MKRFSKHELYKLRNSININMLINEILKIPSKVSQGRLRFLCPVCSQFNTATKRRTNLARCFRCQRNFNTIEMVMETKGLEFIESAQFLQDLLPENNFKKITANKPFINPNTRGCNNGPEHIGNVLKTILSPKPVVDPSGSGENLSDRLLALEQKLERMARRIEEIAKSLS